MKQDLENCPYCGIVINNMEKKMRFCQNCHAIWNEKNEIEEINEPYKRPKSKSVYRANVKREPNEDRYYESDE